MFPKSNEQTDFSVCQCACSGQKDVQSSPGIWAWILGCFPGCDSHSVVLHLIRHRSLPVLQRGCCGLAKTASAFDQPVQVLTFTLGRARRQCQMCWKGSEKSLLVLKWTWSNSIFPCCFLDAKLVWYKIKIKIWVFVNCARRFLSKSDNQIQDAQSELDIIGYDTNTVILINIQPKIQTLFSSLALYFL